MTTSAAHRIDSWWFFVFISYAVRIGHTRCIGYRQIAFGAIENKGKTVVELEPFVVAGRIEFRPPLGNDDRAHGQSSVDKSDLKTEIKTI